MKPTFIALLAFSLYLPLMGADKDKPKPLPKDFKSMKALAEKGDARAQVNLGMRHYKGEGVLEDYVTAYAWMNIAAAKGNATAKENKGIMAKEMTPDQIAKAQELSKEMVKKNPKLLEK